MTVRRFVDIPDIVFHHHGVFIPKHKSFETYFTRFIALARTSSTENLYHLLQELNTN